MFLQKTEHRHDDALKELHSHGQGLKPVKMAFAVLWRKELAGPMVHALIQ